MGVRHFNHPRDSFTERRWTSDNLSSSAGRFSISYSSFDVYSLRSYLSSCAGSTLVVKLCVCRCISESGRKCSRCCLFSLRIVLTEGLILMWQQIYRLYFATIKKKLYLCASFWKITCEVWLIHFSALLKQKV